MQEAISLVLETRKKGQGYACASIPAACSIQSPVSEVLKVSPFFFFFKAVKHFKFLSYISYEGSSVVKLCSYVEK